jgi:hypothetical protein
MAKDKSKKKADKGGDVDTKGEAQSFADDDFAKPSEAPAGGDGWNLTEEAEGELLLITPKREEQVETKDYGAKPVIVCDVVVLNAKKPEKSEAHADVFVFGGYLRGSLKGFIGQRRVLARLVRGTVKERGNYPWLFEDATEADKDIARAYLASVDPFKQ